MIAAIIRSAGCFGVLYVDNAMADDHYSLSDLDYLMLLAMHTETQFILPERLPKKTLTTVRE